MIDARSTVPSRNSNPLQEELSALPIWTVTLGVFSLLTFGLTALASIICGHVALSKTSSGKSGSFEKSVITVGLVMGYAGAAVFGVWISVLVGHLLR
jgi:uncharacterized protein YaaW (UPF0174 family)